MASIGKPIDRVDGHLKVTGRAKYAAEFVLPDAVNAVLVQSTIGAGEVVGFDLDKAKAMPGVLAIITPDNALKLAQKGGTQQTVHAPLLQDMRVHYNGQHIAVAVADTLDRFQRRHRAVVKEVDNPRAAALAATRKGDAHFTNAAAAADHVAAFGIRGNKINHMLAL